MFVVTFSGGKDSVATWLYLSRELGAAEVVCIFADTGHESGLTYSYLDVLEKEHCLPLVRVQPRMEDFRGELVEEKVRDRMGWGLDVDVWSQPLDMERLCILKRRFPGSMSRFCTEHLKLRPCARWIKANCGPDTVIASGVRAEESPSRAKKPEMSIDPLTGLKFWLPIHKWTHEQVFDLHRKHGVPPNPLYLSGMSRVGCWPCIMARKGELSMIAKRFPEAFDRLKAMEERAAESCGKPLMSFFSNHKTPERFHSGVCPTQENRFRQHWMFADGLLKMIRGSLGRVCCFKRTTRRTPIRVRRNMGFVNDLTWCQAVVSRNS